MSRKRAPDAVVATAAQAAAQVAIAMSPVKSPSDRVRKQARLGGSPLALGRPALRPGRFTTPRAAATAAARRLAMVRARCCPLLLKPGWGRRRLKQRRPSSLLARRPGIMRRWRPRLRLGAALSSVSPSLQLSSPLS